MFEIRIPDLKKYEKDVLAFEARPSETGKIVFYGSSGFTLWKTWHSGRSLEEDMELTLQLSDFEGLTPLEHVELYCPDLKAVNEKDSSPVQPQKRELPQLADGCAQLKLKKHSWNMVRFACK